MSAEAEKLRRVSYKVSHILACQMRPFTEGDFIRECLLTMVDGVCPERRAALEGLRLSPDTVRRCVEEMSDNVRETLTTRCSNFAAFSLAVADTSDTQDTARPAVFVRGVTADLQVCEEFLQLVPLCSTGSGQDICDAVLQCVGGHSLDLSRLVCVATDGGPAMVGGEGVASLLVRRREAAGHTRPISVMHCLLQPRALCAGSAALTGVMAAVGEVVDSILSRGRGHPPFQALVEEVDLHYSDLPYLCEGHWLGRGALLSGVCDLQQEIAAFLRQENLPHADQFSDPRWLAGLALLADLTAHLNTLNSVLQGQDVLVTDMYTHVTAFEAKLRLWEGQLASGVFVHFPRLAAAAAAAAAAVDLNTCAGVVTSLREEIASRFAGVREVLAVDLKLFTAPFDFPVQDAPAPLQAEVVALQHNRDMKAKFRASSPLSFFRDVVLPSNNFKEYVAHVRRVVATFGGAHCCERVFSKMKCVTPDLRCQLSDRHLSDLLLLSASTIQPDLETLLHGKHRHQPH